MRLNFRKSHVKSLAKVFHNACQILLGTLNEERRNRSETKEKNVYENTSDFSSQEVGSGVSIE